MSFTVLYKCSLHRLNIAGRDYASSTVCLKHSRAPDAAKLKVRAPLDIHNDLRVEMLFGTQLFELFSDT